VADAHAIADSQAVCRWGTGREQDLRGWNRGGDPEGSLTADRTTFMYSPTTRTWTKLLGFPGPVGEYGQFLLHPAAAVRVWNEGSGAVLTLGAGHLFADSTFCPPCKPNGTIEPTLSYLYTP
jgi:hypothetical protein